jgi:hypothetical protein
MTLPPFPTRHHTTNPVVTDFLARIGAAKHADDIPAGDLIALAQMVRNGDMVHVDTIPDWIKTQEQARLLDEMRDACRTPEANGWPV